MTDIADRYRRLADTFAGAVAAVPEDQWSSPSPCEGWTARDVVRHVVDTQSMFLGSVGREVGDIPPVDDDPLGAWKAATAVVQADLDDPARATAGYEGFFGPTTFEATVERFGCFDLLVHRWDLARAAGLDDRLDPDEVHRVLVDARLLGDALRGNGICGPEVAPAPGADEQDQLLAFLGRQP